MRVSDSPGQDTNPSQISKSTETSRVHCLAQGHNTVVRPGFKLTIFGLRVKCVAQGHNTVVRPGFELTTVGLRVKGLTQGHTTQWSGRGLSSRPLSYE